MIYFNAASTTKPSQAAVDAALSCMTDHWGNPSDLNSVGEDAHAIIEDAREKIAATINADPEDIYFTSGSTEANNWILNDLNLRYGKIGLTEIDHHSISNYAKAKIAPDKIEIMPVNKYGIITQIPDVSSIFIGAANNEIGTIQDLQAIGDYCADWEIYFAVDATQMYGHMPIDVKKMHIDMLTASAHKFHGIKGCGFIYINSDALLPMNSSQYGGMQERGFRAGTENVPGIAAMGVAAEIAVKNMKRNIQATSQLRNYLYGEITNTIPTAHLNGTADWRKRLPGNLNFRFDGINGEELMAYFDANGIMVSTGSACDSSSHEPSHVLKAIGLTDEQADSSIRFTFDETNTKKECEEVIRVLREGLKILGNSA